MAIADKLNELQATKTALKTAIESKGQDLDGVPFTQYAEVIKAIQGGGGGAVNGKRFATGTVTFLSEGLTKTITHNAGFIPTYFDFWLIDGIPDNGETETDKGCVLCGSFSRANGLKNSNSNISGLAFSSFGGWAKFYSSPYNYRRVTIDQIMPTDKLNENEISLKRAGNNNYKYYANKTYAWIAIE